MAQRFTLDLYSSEVVLDNTASQSPIFSYLPPSFRTSAAFAKYSAGDTWMTRLCVGSKPALHHPTAQS
jgi:hypothetical protein